jgi:DNA-binding CsgD family transcriptional regulator
MEVLQLIAEGKANKETAAELGIGIKTVEKHREHLMQKLDIHDTAGLTRYAIGAGIIESSVQLTIVSTDRTGQNEDRAGEDANGTSGIAQRASQDPDGGSGDADRTGRNTK